MIFFLKSIFSTAYIPDSSLDQKIQAFQHYIEGCADRFSQVLLTEAVL